MAYIMSFSATTWQIECRAKTVTRRLGWAHLRVGDLVQAVEKAQGLKKGEKVRRLQLLRIVDIREERLDTMIYDRYGYLECEKEGFRLMRPEQFVALFCRINRCLPSQAVHRIEFEYEVPLVDPPRAAGAGSVHLDEPAGSEGLGRLQAADAAAHAQHAHAGHAVGTAAVGAGEIAVAQPVHELVLPETVALEVDEARRAVSPEADLQPVAVGAGRVLVDVPDLRASPLGGDGSDVGAGDGLAASWLAAGGEQEQGYGGEQAEHGQHGMDAPNLRRAPTRPLLRYLGGKHRMAPWIIEALPPHERYVEPYAGGVAVLLSKPRVRWEIVGDTDERLTTLLRVMQQPGTFAALRHRLAHTPYSRAEYLRSLLDEGDDVERAARVVVRSWQAFSGATMQRATGFRTDMSRWRNSAAEWQTYLEALPALHERLRGVLVESLPAADTIRLYDLPAPGTPAAAKAPTTLMLVDPPYLPESRGMSARYRHDMTREDHEALLGQVVGVRAMVALCGYRSDLYDEALAGWTRLDRRVQADGNVPGDPRHRVESLWLNPAATAARTPHELALTLFDEAEAEVTA